jgi:hypothetical protein
MRIFLFMVFFSVGAAAVSLAILCDDLNEYYRNRQILKSQQKSLVKMEQLDKDYDAVLRHLDEDPNLVRRLGPATLGIEPNDANTIYPDVSPEQLDAARQVASADDRHEQEPNLPHRLTRISDPRRRTVLFLSGAFLILISFIWFSRPPCS